MDADDRIAIVAEGGGQRGIYTAGVLDAFAGEGFNPFGLGIGVSAGAQNLLAFFIERPGYARQAIERLTAAKDFFVPYRWLTRGNIIDLDGYFERTVSDPDYRLDYPHLARAVEKRRLLFVATCRDTLQPRYLEPTVANAVDCLKASSAVPLLYRGGVSIGGECLIDGGVSDPLPVAKALALGATRVLAVRTTLRDGPSLPGQLQRFRRAGALPSRLVRLIECNERAYREAADALAAAHSQSDIDMVELRPSVPLVSQLFGSRSDALAVDYATGFTDGLELLDRLSSWRTLPAKQPEASPVPAAVSETRAAPWSVPSTG